MATAFFCLRNSKAAEKNLKFTENLKVCRKILRFAIRTTEKNVP